VDTPIALDRKLKRRALSGKDRSFQESTTRRPGFAAEAKWHGLLAATSVLLGTLAARLGVAMLATAVASAALIVWPATIVVTLVTVAQELKPGAFASSSSLLAAGHQLYFGAIFRVPLMGFIVAASALLCISRSKHNAGRQATVLCALAAAATFSVLGWLDGSSIFGALNQHGRPFLLVLGGFAIGAKVRAKDRLVQVMGSLLCVLAVLGLCVALTSTGFALGGRNIMVFYDSATPAVAGAVMLGLLFRNEAWRRTDLLVAGASMTVLLLSFRRNVWLAVIVVALINVTLTRDKRRAITTVVVAAVIALPILTLVAPGVVGTAGQRAHSITGVFAGERLDESTEGHLGDIRVAAALIRKSPITGIGANTGSISGLVAKRTFYVHNEYLMDWALYGVLGLGMVMALFLVTGAHGLSALKAGNDVTSRSAAFFCLLVPVCSITAPFLTTTIRWPTMVGVAAGILSTREENLSPLQGRTLVEVAE
jgi:hypothetical protein